MSNAAADELEWLLEMEATLASAERDPSSILESRRERLTSALAALVRHLDCGAGALLMPDRGFRLAHEAPVTPERRVEAVLSRLERPVLSWVRRKNQPMLVNRGRTPGSLPLRLLAVPLATHPGGRAGALLLIRSTAAPPFTRAHVALVRHVGRLITASLVPDRDAGTGLYTRSSLRDHLEEWSPEERAAGMPHAVVTIKIDRLDVINKTRGFDAGDRLLAGVAALLRDPHLPAGALPARISGNEFAVVLPRTTAEQAQSMAEGLQRLSATMAGGPGERREHEQEPVSLSCGIAAFDSPGELETGLALAQLACRTARRHGAGRIEVYRDTDMSMIQRHTDIIAVQLLREALKQDRLTLFAQRIVPLQDASASGGYELLLRSLDDLSENRAPQHLLSAAQRNHLAPAVDLWVIEHALAEARPYRAVLKDTSLSLSINISGPSLTDQKFLERIHGLIEQSGIPPSLITFEITETVAVLSLAKAVAFIRELRGLGCRFALDDFGTGTNSLKNLTSLPVDRVKIDGSFVSDLLTNRQSDAMVRAIVSLARDLGIGTVAEYAESAAIIDRLCELGVEQAQGYGVERPRPLADVLGELRRR